MTCERCKANTTRQSNYVLCEDCKADLRAAGRIWCRVCQADGVPAPSKSSGTLLCARHYYHRYATSEAERERQRIRSRLRRRARGLIQGAARPCARCGKPTQHGQRPICVACRDALLDEGLAWCSRCNTPQDSWSFDRSWCRDCTNAYNRERYQRDAAWRARRNAAARAYQQRRKVA